MSTQTLNAETLVSEWNNATKDISKVQISYRLASLLEDELSKCITPEEELLLKEFREKFDFNACFSVKTQFDMDCDYTHDIDCEDAEEVSLILSGKKEISEEKIIEEMIREDVHLEIYGIGAFKPSVFIYKLRLKQNEEECAYGVIKQ